MRKKLTTLCLIFAVLLCMFPAFSAEAGTATGKWKHNDKGWWYEYSDGSYAKNEFVTIKGKTYYFGKNGYMVTGWKAVEIDADSYYEYGYTGRDNYKYWYYFDADGVMQTGWKKINKKWFYFGSNGVMRKNWQKISNKWYYFNENGYMVTGWKKLAYAYYSSYEDYENGEYDISWDGSSYWYYFQSDGSIAQNEYLNGYYIRSDGSWDENGTYAWKKYVYEDNHWEWRYVNLNSHEYLKSRNWVKIDKKYYFFDPYGSLFGNFYIGNNEDGFHWVDANGTWIYKGKLIQQDSGEYISEKDKMFGKYKDTYGFIPTGSYVFYYTKYNSFADYELYLPGETGLFKVTFDSTGKVVSSLMIYYDSKNHFFYQKGDNFSKNKLIFNSSGQVVSTVYAGQY